MKSANSNLPFLPPIINFSGHFTTKIGLINRVGLRKILFRDMLEMHRKLGFIVNNKCTEVESAKCFFLPSLYQFRTNLWTLDKCSLGFHQHRLKNSKYTAVQRISVIFVVRKFGNVCYKVALSVKRVRLFIPKFKLGQLMGKMLKFMFFFINSRNIGNVKPLWNLKCNPVICLQFFSYNITKY